jgi:hypothetical protein
MNFHPLKRHRMNMLGIAHQSHYRFYQLNISIDSLSLLYEGTLQGYFILAMRVGFV